MHFWLYHNAHCVEKIVSARWWPGSALAERVGQGEVGGVTRRVLCTWQLLGLAVKEPWLAPSGSIPALVAHTGLENVSLTSWRVHFWQGRWLGFWAGICQPRMLTIACLLMSGRGKGHKSAYWGWKCTWVQFWSQSLDRNGDTVR